MENACKRPITLKVTNATLEDVIAKARIAFPAKTRIEVRDARPVHVSFDLKATTAGEALQSVGALAGCKVWLFDDHLLISPLESLIPSENKDVDEQTGGEWGRSVAAGGSGWSAQIKGVSTLLDAMVKVFDQRRLLTNAVATPVLTTQNTGPAATSQTQGNTASEAGKSPQPKPTVVTLGELSPDAQAVLTQLVAWQNESSRRNPMYQPIILAPDTKITFDESQEQDHVSLGVHPHPDDSNSHPTMAGWGFKRRKG